MEHQKSQAQLNLENINNKSLFSLGGVHSEEM